MDGNPRYSDQPDPRYYPGPGQNPYDDQRGYGPPPGNYDGPPPGNYDGPPPGNYDGPPPGNYDGPPPGNYDGPPPGNYDGPPGNYGPEPTRQSRSSNSLVDALKSGGTKPSGAGPRGGGEKRPMAALIFPIVTIVLMIPAILLLIQAMFGAGSFAPGGIVPSVLLTLGLPLTGVGLFALASPGPKTLDDWLRPPLAYLPVGLLVLLAAGLGAA